MFRRSNSKELIFLRNESNSKRNAIYLFIYEIWKLLQILMVNFRGAHSQSIG